MFFLLVSGLVLDPPWVHLDMEAVEVVFFGVVKETSVNFFQTC